MVISAYYSELGQQRCKDCGEELDWRKEHHCITSGMGGMNINIQSDSYKAYQELRNGRNDSLSRSMEKNSGRIDSLSRSNSARMVSLSRDRQPPPIRPTDNRFLDPFEPLSPLDGYQSDFNVQASDYGYQEDDYRDEYSKSNFQNDGYSKRPDQQDDYRYQQERPTLRSRSNAKGPTCGKCQQGIMNLDDAFEIEALQSWYHVDCFCCSVCNRMFDDDFPFVPHEGQAYCEQHYEEMFLPSCAACKKPITDGKISYAFGTTFHSRHLRVFQY